MKRPEERAFAAMVLALWTGKSGIDDIDRSPNKLLLQFGLRPRSDVSIVAIRDTPDAYHLVIPVGDPRDTSVELPIWTYPPKAREPFEAKYWAPIRMPEIVIRRAWTLSRQFEVAVEELDAQPLLFAAGANPQRFRDHPKPLFIRDRGTTRYLVIPSPPSENLSAFQLTAVAQANNWCWQVSSAVRLLIHD